MSTFLNIYFKWCHTLIDFKFLHLSNQRRIISAAIIQNQCITTEYSLIDVGLILHIITFTYTAILTFSELSGFWTYVSAPAIRAWKKLCESDMLANNRNISRRSPCLQPNILDDLIFSHYCVILLCRCIDIDVENQKVQI